MFMLTKFKHYGWDICVFLAIFISMFIFFTGAHPLIIYDGDDWANLSHMRHFIPMWHGFNPIKILPETLMPLVGYLSGYVVTPIVKNYVVSVTIVSALLVSSFITMYIYLFSRFIGTLGNQSRYGDALICIVLFLSHFFIFKQKSDLSNYLFRSFDLTCYFHYLIPAVLNISLVLYFFRHELKKDNVWTENMVKNSILIFILYLGIFSNILQSVILAVFTGVLLLGKEGKRLFFPKEWKRIFKENPLYCSILIVWFISLFFEASGGRARSIAIAGFISPVLDTLKILGESLRQINFIFLIFSLVIILFTIYSARQNHSAFATCVLKIIRICFTCMFFVLIYLVLVCSKANPLYIGRTDVGIGILFWYIFIFGVSLAYLIQEYPKCFLAAPVIAVMVLVETINGRSAFMESNIVGVSPRNCYAVDMDILNQIQLADQRNVSELELHVPKGDNRDNWPHPDYMGKNICQTLYRDGIISRTFDIQIVPDINMNKKYHIPIP